MACVTPYVGVWIETLITSVASAKTTVTPYVGVWIETKGTLYQIPRVPSLLMWECGLKPCVKGKGSVAGGVTPYVGVWIETSNEQWNSSAVTVTPYVGVWIET